MTSGFPSQRTNNEENVQFDDVIMNHPYCCLIQEAILYRYKRDIIFHWRNVISATYQLFNQANKTVLEDYAANFPQSILTNQFRFSLTRNIRNVENHIIGENKNLINIEMQFDQPYGTFIDISNLISDSKFCTLDYAARYIRWQQADRPLTFWTICNGGYLVRAGLPKCVYIEWHWL